MVKRRTGVKSEKEDLGEDQEKGNFLGGRQGEGRILFFLYGVWALRRCWR